MDDLDHNAPLDCSSPNDQDGEQILQIVAHNLFCSSSKAPTRIGDDLLAYSLVSTCRSIRKIGSCHARRWKVHGDDDDDQHFDIKRISIKNLTGMRTSGWPSLARHNPTALTVNLYDDNGVVLWKLIEMCPAEQLSYVEILSDNGINTTTNSRWPFIGDVQDMLITDAYTGAAETSVALGASLTRLFHRTPKLRSLSILHSKHSGGDNIRYDHHYLYGREILVVVPGMLSAICGLSNLSNLDLSGLNIKASDACALLSEMRTRDMHAHLKKLSIVVLAIIPLAISAALRDEEVDHSLFSAFQGLVKPSDRIMIASSTSIAIRKPWSVLEHLMIHRKPCSSQPLNFVALAEDLPAIQSINLAGWVDYLGLDAAKATLTDAELMYTNTVSFGISTLEAEEMGLPAPFDMESQGRMLGLSRLSMLSKLVFRGPIKAGSDVVISEVNTERLRELHIIRCGWPRRGRFAPLKMPANMTTIVVLSLIHVTVSEDALAHGKVWTSCPNLKTLALHDVHFVSTTTNSDCNGSSATMNHDDDNDILANGSKCEIILGSASTTLLAHMKLDVISPKKVTLMNEKCCELQCDAMIQMNSSMLARCTQLYTNACLNEGVCEEDVVVIFGGSHLTLARLKQLMQYSSVHHNYPSQHPRVTMLSISSSTSNSQNNNATTTTNALNSLNALYSSSAPSSSCFSSSMSSMPSMQRCSARIDAIKTYQTFPNLRHLCIHDGDASILLTYVISLAEVFKNRTFRFDIGTALLRRMLVDVLSSQSSSSSCSSGNRINVLQFRMKIPLVEDDVTSHLAIHLPFDGDSSDSAASASTGTGTGDAGQQPGAITVRQTPRSHALTLFEQVFMQQQKQQQQQQQQKNVHYAPTIHTLEIWGLSETRLSKFCEHAKQSPHLCRVMRQVRTLILYPASTLEGPDPLQDVEFGAISALCALIPNTSRIDLATNLSNPACIKRFTKALRSSLKTISLRVIDQLRIMSNHIHQNAKCAFTPSIYTIDHSL